MSSRRDQYFDDLGLPTVNQLIATLNASPTSARATAHLNQWRAEIALRALYLQSTGLLKLWVRPANKYNHIVWETPADLREKLTARVQATLVAPVR